jgi:hypothetical protein
VTLADAPTTWAEPPETSMLELLLVFVGIPLLVVVVISLLVMAPSIAKGPRFSPGQPWDAEPEWFGAPERTQLGTAPQQRQLQGSTRTTDQTAGAPNAAVTGDEKDSGGASVRW